MRPLGMYAGGAGPSMRKKIEEYSYLLEDQIGKGFSARVFRGVKDETGQTVAVKVIELRGLKDKVGVTMLQSEIEILKQLQHPNLLRLHNVYSTLNNCYIVTEFCSGGDLATLLKSRRRLPESEANLLFSQIFSGFRQLAQRNIIHRDLKPANIFLQDGKAKIADFGFAKFAQGAGIREKYNVGTPLYMSPEALKHNVYSIKNDIWSLGVVLYEMIHGDTPWESRSQQELMDKIVRVPPQFRVNCSDQLKHFINMCCHVDESRRFSVQDMESHPFLAKLITKKEVAKPQATQVQVHFQRKYGTAPGEEIKAKRERSMERPVKQQRQNRTSEEEAKQLREMLKIKKAAQEKVPSAKDLRAQRTSQQQAKQLRQMVKVKKALQQHKGNKEHRERASQEEARQLREMLKAKKANQDKKVQEEIADSLEQKKKLLEQLKSEKTQLLKQMAAKSSQPPPKPAQKKPTKQLPIKSLETVPKPVQNQSKPLNQSQLQIKKNCKVVIAVVNLCRYIYKTLQATGLQQAPGLLRSYLGGVMALLKQLTAGSSNVLNLKNFQQFVLWNGFTRYKQAISEYWQKYSPIFIGTAEPLNIFDIQKRLRMFCAAELKRFKQLEEEGVEFDSKLEKAATLLQRLVNLFGVTAKLGVTLNFEQFAGESKIDKLVEGGGKEQGWSELGIVRLRAQELGITQ